MNDISHIHIILHDGEFGLVELIMLTSDVVSTEKKKKIREKRSRKKKKKESKLKLCNQRPW